MSSQENAEDIPTLQALQTAQPVVARRTFRRGCYFKEYTCGLCRGFIQANIAGIHGSFADEFAEFCRINEGPLPLLFQSKPGVFAAPPLADDSDVRTDLSAYNVLQKGEYVDVVKDLLQFGEVLNEYAFFYTGCSFSFDKILLDAGIPLAYANNPDATVGMYTTNIQCHPVGSIKGPLVVSMRPIPRDLVQTAVRATSPLRDIHGAPIHIGSSACIGIKDLFNPEYGDAPVPLKEDQIPVYWACGNTIKEVLKHTKHSLSFTMFADCMFLTDLSSTTKSSGQIPEEEKPVVIDMADDPYTASLVSVGTLAKITKLQKYLKEGVNNQSTKNDAFIRTCLSLSHASSVGLIVGPRERNLHDDQNDNTGLMATITMAMLLQVLGKDVTLLVHSASLSNMERIVESLVHKGILQEALHLIEYPSLSTNNPADTAREVLTKADGITPRFDYLASLGGTEQQTDEVYNHVFRATTDLSMFLVYGMEIIDQGSHDVASSVYCYAITIALYLLRVCPVHDRYRRRGIGFLPSDSERQTLRNALLNTEKETTVLDILKKHGVSAEDKVRGTVPDLEHFLNVL